MNLFPDKYYAVDAEQRGVARWVWSCAILVSPGQEDEAAVDGGGGQSATCQRNGVS